MDVERFAASVARDTPPHGLSNALQALWQDAKGDWDAAHTLAQTQNDAAGAWVHAYLHRVEGDLANAGYWYHRAGRSVCTAPLPDEWREIAASLLP